METATVMKISISIFGFYFQVSFKGAEFDCDLIKEKDVIRN